MYRIDYEEIARAKVTESRNIIISKCSKGGYTIAQQLEVLEGIENKTTNVFMKGAFHIDNIEGLYNLRDAINISIKKIENGDVDNTTWDE